MPLPSTMFTSAAGGIFMLPAKVMSVDETYKLADAKMY
jgi:hypothetical protein